jgi:hypothetical protein
MLMRGKYILNISNAYMQYGHLVQFFLASPVFFIYVTAYPQSGLTSFKSHPVIGMSPSGHFPLKKQSNQAQMDSGF